MNTTILISMAPIAIVFKVIEESSARGGWRLKQCFRLSIAIAGGLLLSGSLLGQELEPRAYLVTPVNSNAVVTTYVRASGDALFDPTLPIDEVKGTINTFVLSYYRSMDFFGRSANFTVSAPYKFGSIEGLYIGDFTSVYRSGIADPRIRFAVNLVGGPAMNLKELREHKNTTNLGFSISVAPPVGQYDTNKLLNIGTNRWSFKPELGLSRTLGKGRRWSVEASGGAWLFTNNNDYFGGGTRQQKPIGSGQFHLVYRVKGLAWASFDANAYFGGRTTVNGTERFDLQKNSRIGGTFAYPFAKHHSIKVSLNTGAYTTIGAAFTIFSVGYQYSWIDGH